MTSLRRDSAGLTSAGSFYRHLLAEIAVPEATIRQAVEKRDGLAVDVRAALHELGLRDLGLAGVGSIQTGTQINPLNDVDVLVWASNVRDSWAEDPLHALLEISGALTEQGYWCTPSSHAIRVVFRDVRFTADVVFGRTHPEGGLEIPHCPTHSQHAWIRTDPQAHARLLRDRVDALGPSFGSQLQILKALNKHWAGPGIESKKPVSSHYLTALMLEVVQGPIDYPLTTPLLLERGAALVARPLADPARIGPPIQPRDPLTAARLMKTAARELRQALHDDSRALSILRRTFGRPMLGVER